METSIKIILIICLLFLCNTLTSAEIYQWTDSDGSVHFSDTPVNVPKGKKPTVRSDEPNVNSSTSPKHSRPFTVPEKIIQQSPENNNIIPPDPRFASPDMTWNLYKESLVKGDLESVLQCLSPNYALIQQQIFQPLGKEGMKKIGLEMRPIQKVKQDKETAKYRIRKNEKGKEITYYIQFINIEGNWKIDAF
jgi:hypothetical protein